MTTIYVSEDRSFQIRTGSNSTPLPKCLHVQPGVIDFPGRCNERPGHRGDHKGAVIYVGISGAGLFPPERWENTGA